MTDSNLRIDSSRIPNCADAHPASTIGYNEVDRNECWNSATDWHTTKKRETYKRFSELNDGKLVVSGRYNDSFITYSQNKDTIESIGSQVELTQDQHRQALRYFSAFDLEQWGINAEYVAFTLCMYLVHTDEGDVRECHPMNDSEAIPDEFLRVRDSLQITSSSLCSTFGKVQTMIENENPRYNISDEPFRIHLRGEGRGI